MSIILDSLLSRPHEITKSKNGEPKTSFILLISVALFLAFVLLTSIGVLFPNTMNQDNTCRDKIVGYEQSGIYTSPEQFKLAMSYCGTS